MKSNTVLVTGAAGFIGSHLCERLIKDGYEVIGIDNFDTFYDKSIKEFNLIELKKEKKFQFIEGDITDPGLFEQLLTPVDTVFHLAAKAGVLPSIKAPASYIHVNISGTQNILDWMVKKNVKKMVFASSSSIYGNNKKIPFSEDDNVDRPVSPYAFTKKACELMLHTYFHLYEVNTVCLRFFTVYGERQRPDLAIHKFIRQITNNQEITLYGTGNTSRDYTYIDDIINGILSAFLYINTKDRVYEIINLGNNSPVSLNNLVQIISEALKMKPQIKFLPVQPGDVEITYADIIKAKTLLGYMPSTDFKSGIKNFVKWFLEINSVTFKI